MKPFSQWNEADVAAHNARVTGRPAPEATPSRSQVLEAEIQEQIEEWLKQNFPRAWYDRKRMDKPTTSREGVPDFVGVIAGQAFGMEVKRPGEKPTTKQLGELHWLRLAGAKTAVVYSIDEAITFLKSL